MWRVISLLMASLLLWCGTLLLYLSLYDTGQSQGKAACLGALLATLGGIWLWARFFGLCAPIRYAVESFVEQFGKQSAKKRGTVASAELQSRSAH